MSTSYGRAADKSHSFLLSNTPISEINNARIPFTYQLFEQNVDGTIDIEYMLKNHSQALALSSYDANRYMFEEQAFWFRYEIKNDTEHETTRFFEIVNAYLDRYLLYETLNGKVLSQKEGVITFTLLIRKFLPAPLYTNIKLQRVKRRFFIFISIL